MTMKSNARNIWVNVILAGKYTCREYVNVHVNTQTRHLNILTLEDKNARNTILLNFIKELKDIITKHFLVMSYKIRTP